MCVSVYLRADIGPRFARMLNSPTTRAALTDMRLARHYAGDDGRATHQFALGVRGPFSYHVPGWGALANSPARVRWNVRIRVR